MLPLWRGAIKVNLCNSKHLKPSKANINSVKLIKKTWKKTRWNPFNEVKTEMSELARGYLRGACFPESKACVGSLQNTNSSRRFPFCFLTKTKTEPGFSLILNRDCFRPTHKTTWIEAIRPSDSDEIAVNEPQLGDRSGTRQWHRPIRCWSQRISKRERNRAE